MGSDITTFTEVFDGESWKAAGNVFLDNEDDPSCVFDGARNYSLFGFLADMRNRANSPVISPARGIPDDASDDVRKHYWPDMDICASWLTLIELLCYDYDQEFIPTEYYDEDWRPGDKVALKDFLGEWYFERLELLGELGEPDKVRIVFWFDC